MEPAPSLPAPQPSHASPRSALECKPTENPQLIFDLTIDDTPAGGSRQLMCNSGDRSYWGRLQLVP